MLAPIVLFAYNRPSHVRQSVESLKSNGLAAESDLYVFSDGPKDSANAEKVQEVRAYLHAIDGFRSVTVVESDVNKGLARSIIEGVTDVCNKMGRAIVLEDDIVVSRHFLQYMNESLEMYAEDEKVISIGAYMFPIKRRLPDTFFFRVTDCWGWGVWKRAWDLFEADGAKLLRELRARNLHDEFDLAGGFKYTDMLQAQIRGDNDSWAVRWYATALLGRKLTLYPGVSMTRNIGHDGSGRHSGESTTYDTEMAKQPITVRRIPIEEHREGFDLIRDFLSSGQSMSARLKTRISRFIHGS